jgi:hypothetical protein
MHGFQPEHRRGISPFGYLGLAMPHKFEVGQMVRAELPGVAWGDPTIPGTYTVTQQLPEREGVFEYSITSPTEPYERVAVESELIAYSPACVKRYKVQAVALPWAV